MELKDWLGENNQIGQDIWHKKYQYDNETFDQWLDRVSGGNKDVRKLIKEKRFLFGGRVLANRGIEESGNFYNCFSAGYIEDDFSKIMDTLKEVAVTFKIQGGQGISMTKLRPKGTPVGTEYESDGIINFMNMFNSVTNNTSQGGARRGALLISLDIRHKDASDFINIKTDLNVINNANLSLEIDNEFMSAIEEYYNTGKIIVLHEKREYSGHVIEYDITPINLYKKMMEVVWDYAEPKHIWTL